MKSINFNNWQVYYMDNDGRKQILKSGLSYMAACKLWQWYNTNNPLFGLDYEPKQNK